MRKHIKNIILAVFTLSVTLVFSQKKSNDTINTGVIDVVKPYTPTISDAFKVKEVPSLNDEAAQTKKDIKYNIFSFPVASTFAPAKGKAATVDKAKPVKLYDNYATFGVGSYTTFLGEVYLNHAISRTESVGGYVSHLSSGGGIEGLSYDDNFSNSKVNVNYASRLRDLSWNVEGGFQYQNYNWYGVSQSFIADAQTNNIQTDHSFFDAHFGGDISFKDTYVNSGSFFFRRFGDNQGSGENNFVLKAKADVPIQDMEISTDVIINYLSGGFDRSYSSNDELKYGNFQLGISPTYQLKQDDLTLNLGVSLFYLRDNVATKSKIYLYPNVTASYRLVNDVLIAYGGLKGDLIQNTYYGFANENPFVSPTPGLAFEDAGCIFCGQCTKVCPTGTLHETDHIKRVEALLRDPNKKVVVQMAPAVRAAIGEEFGYPVGTPVKLIQPKMYESLKLLGFDDITDTNWAADLTILEEGTELIGRIKNGGKLPLFTSCSPGWIRYTEMYRPEYMDNLSTAKSPHMMQGAMIKGYYAPKYMDTKPENVAVVSIMPCTAKKYEISREEMEVDGVRDVDAVLTVRELGKLIKKNDIDFRNLEGYEPTSHLAQFTGAGTIFGASGGVAEAALRTVYEVLEEKPLEKLEFEVVRGADFETYQGFIKEATVTVAGIKLNCAVVHGGAALKEMYRRLDEGKKQYHFVEFMACPGGCVNGGGMPVCSSMSMEQVIKKRAQSLYDQDANDTELRMSHKNPSITKVYEEFLTEPNSKIAHKYLHTHYSQKEFRKE